MTGRSSREPRSERFHAWAYSQPPCEKYFDCLWFEPKPRVKNRVTIDYIHRKHCLYAVACTTVVYCSCSTSQILNAERHLVAWNFRERTMTATSSLGSRGCTNETPEGEKQNGNRNREMV